MSVRELVAALLYAACMHVRTSVYATRCGIPIPQAKAELTECEVLCLQACGMMSDEERSLWLQ